MRKWLVSAIEFVSQALLPPQMYDIWPRCSNCTISAATLSQIQKAEIYLWAYVYINVNFSLKWVVGISEQEECCGNEDEYRAIAREVVKLIMQLAALTRS